MAPPSAIGRAAGSIPAILGGAAVVIVLAAPDCRADPIRVQAKLNQFIEVDDNPLLVARDQEAAIGSVTSPEIALDAALPAFSGRAGLRADVNRYDLKGMDSEDYHGTLGTRWSGETWNAGVAAKADYDTTRTSELEASGLTAAGIRHTALSLSPDIGAALTQRDTVSLSGSLLSSRYADTRRYTNYEVYAIAPRYAHAFDPLDTGLATVRVSRFTTRTGLSSTVDTIAPELGWERRFSATLTGSAMVGVQRMTSSGAALGAAGAGPHGASIEVVFESRLTYRDEQDQLSLGLDRQPQPMADGNMTTSTTLTAQATHVVAPRLSLKLNGSYRINAYPGERGENNQTTYLSLEPRLSYQPYQDLDLGLSFRYREKTSLAGDSARSHAIVLNLVLTSDSMGLGL